LGLWLDRNLRWGKHINEARDNILNFIKLFKVLSGSGWGVHPIHLRHLYIAVVRSRIDYACFLYGNSSDSLLAKLDRLQNICLRIIGGFIKSTPIHVMHSELCISPLFIRRQYLASKFYLKHKSYPHNALLGCLGELTDLTNSLYWRRKKKPLLLNSHILYSLIPMHSTNQLGMFSLNTWVTNIDLSEHLHCQITDISIAKRYCNNQQLQISCFSMLNNAYRGHYKLFTDGSKHEDCSGLAFLDWQTGESHKLRIACKISIMYTEMIAVLEALSYIQGINHKNFVILTDSKSTIQHIARCTGNARGIPLGYVIIDLISRMKSAEKHVVIQWIPSHIGISGNEEVDRLAKAATSDADIFHCLPLHTDILYQVKKDCRKKWSEYFDERSLSKGIWYKSIQPTLPHSPWYEKTTDIERSHLVTALRLRSGHVPLNSFGYMMKKVDSPNCTICNVVEDVFHIIMECTRTNDLRNKLNINMMLEYVTVY
jgi:ribonuclease HI